MSTTSSSAAPSSTDFDSGPGSFLGSGGSTLILAFLAIGLFAGGLLVMFSMRRYVNLNRRRIRAWHAAQQPWGWDEAALGPPPTLLMSMNVQMRPHRDFGRKPELSDLSAAVSNECDWHKVMPVAAKPLYNHPLPSSTHGAGGSADSATIGQNPSPSSSASPTITPGYLYPFRVGLRDTRAQIANLRAPWSRQTSGNDSPSPAPAPRPMFAPASRRTETAPGPSHAAERVPTRVEVALTIAMPSQTPCPTQGRVPLFALGVTTVRWSGEPLAKGQEDTTVTNLSPSSSRYPHTDADDTSLTS